VFNQILLFRHSLLDLLLRILFPCQSCLGFIELAQALAKDPKALAELSMDRTSASYKLTHGVKKTILDEVLEEIRSVPFSLKH